MCEDQVDMPQGGDSPAEPPRLEVPFPKKKRHTVRNALLFIVFLLAGYAVYTVAYVYLSPDRRIQQIYLVPGDAAFIVCSSEPVEDWQRFSSSGPWQSLAKSNMFTEIGRRASYLDSMVQDNKVLLSLVGRRDLIISVHKTRADDWDFLLIMDLQKASKLNTLKDQIENILKLTGSEVTQRRYRGVNITEMLDAETHEILYMAFVDNHLVASYTSRLVQAAIDERDSPGIGLDDSFIRADKLVAGKGLCRVFVNYANLPEFLALYLGNSEPVEALGRSMDFAGLWFDVESDKMEVGGYTLMKEEANPYVQALFGSGKRKTTAHDVVPARTALYVGVAMDNTAAFVDRLDAILSRSDSTFYNSYLAARKLVERYFDISVDENLLSWMDGEFAFAQCEPGLLGREPERVIALKAKSIALARKNMDLLRKKMGYRSPVRFRTVEYKGYEINYVEVRGIFRQLMGRMLGGFDALYYSFVGDFVVMSDQPSSLLSCIEDYEQKNVLGAADGFRSVQREVAAASTLFVYVDMPKFFPQLRGILNAQTWADLQPDRDVLCSFPRWVLQICGGGRESTVQFLMQYAPDEQVVEVIGALVEEDGPDGGDQSEKELMGELKRFYVEKFEGNVLREFYPEGPLKSEAETRRGRRNGRYREYYPSGALKVRGRYADDRPRGTWKYYTEEGAFERKEKF